MNAARSFFAASRLIQSVRIATAATIIISAPALAQSAPSAAAPAERTATLAQADKTAAIRAVQNTLPSVAILGQKAGPSDTIEVFIQVPGVLNMQSVYVLSDRTSVISGVVVPPVSGSYPGGQLELPTGKPTIDPRAPRKNMSQMNRVLELGSEGGSAPSAASVPIPQTAGATARTSSSASQSMSEHVPAPAMPESIPEPAVSNSGSDTRTQATAPEAAPSEQTVVTSEQSGAPTGGVQSDSATDSARSEPAPGADTAAAPDGSAPSAEKPFGGNGVIESLSDVSSHQAFGQAVSAMLDSDSDISRLKSLEGNPDSQRAGFLEIVKSLPAVVQGNSDRKAYVLFDPNCPVCHRYYHHLSADVTSGRVEVHWIPAVVFPDRRSSITAGAALLAEVDRGSEGNAPAMLDSLMTVTGYSEKIDQSPGVDRLVPYIDPVIKNTAVMTIANPATPLTVFEHREQGLALFTGVPEKDYISLIKPS